MPRLRAGAKCIARRWSRSQLPVLLEHRAARTADTPAMRGKRRAAAKQIAPGHAPGMIAQPCGGRLAWRQFGKVDCAGARGQGPHKQTCDYHHFHGETVPRFLAGRALPIVKVAKNPVLLCAAQKPYWAKLCEALQRIENVELFVGAPVNLTQQGGWSSSGRASSSKFFVGASHWR